MMEEKFLQEVLDRLLTLHEDLQHRAKDATDPSRKNLYRYLRLRGFDLTQLQGDLARVGLSSLGRSHGCIQNAVEKNIYILQRLLDKAPVSQFDPLDYDKAARIALENTKIFEQNSKDDRFKTKIMVTLPGIAAYDEKLIDNLVKSYASVLRINTAHDGPKEWAMMAQKIKQANTRHNREVKIYVDLAGPKNRTGPIQKVFTPFKIGSKKDPKPVRLVGPQHQTMPVSANAHDLVQAFLSVSSEFLDVAGYSDSVEVYDPIKQKSFLFALQRDSEGIFFYASKKVNITKDTNLKIIDYKDRYESNLHNFLLTPEAIRLYANDRIIIAKPPVQGQSEYEYKGSVYEAIISCSNEAIFDHVKKGHKVFIDDGKIGCRVEAIDEIGLICRVETAKPKGQVLKEAKGLNFPDTDLEIDAITQEDKVNFEHTVEFADIYGLSFAQSAKDRNKTRICQSALYTRCAAGCKAGGGDDCQG